MSTAKTMKRPPSSKGKPVVEKIIPQAEPVVEKGPLKVLLCASEAMPFIKTGGLADVAGALPVALNQEGLDVRVILPKYRLIPYTYICSMEHVVDFTVLMGSDRVYCGIDTIVENGVRYYFVDNLALFGGDRVYTGDQDEGYRFAFFCRAILEALPRIGWFPDVLHGNDWQCGLLSVLLRAQYGIDERYRAIRTVYTIHNLKFQGLFDFHWLNGYLGLNGGYFSPENLEFYGLLSCMKGGIVFSDRVTTVSPTYAEEIKTAYFGERLDGLLRKRQHVLSGILNGIDTDAYDPETDRFLRVTFSGDNRRGKAVLKASLQQECGLEQRPEAALIGFIARLTAQKGLDLIERVLDDIMRQDVQLVFLGLGDRHYEDFIRDAQNRYPGRVAAKVEMNEALAHRVYAGTDMFLMPSQFEPCGLSQMIAMRYGSIPIVRETGGLKDSVQPFNVYTDEGNGFSFSNYNAHDMLFTIERAVGYFRDEALWDRLVKRAMATDFSWHKSALVYKKLYEGLMEQ